MNILKAKKVAVVGDTTGYGTTAVNASAAGFQKDGAEVVYKANIDATQPDMTPDMLRAAQCRRPGDHHLERLHRHDRPHAEHPRHMGWDVPFIGHPSLSSGEIAQLIDKPANWEKVYAIGYKSCSYDASGKLPPRNQELVERLQGKINLQDTLLWWVANGIDAVNLVAKAVEESGSSSKEAIIGYWNTLKNYPGLFRRIQLQPDRP